MRLLWVENHVAFVRVAGRQFLAAHSLTVVPSLAEARRVLAEQSFDAILLDYDLDDGKVASLFDRINELVARPVVIAASAHADGNEALRQAGADLVCAKGQFDQIEAILTQAIAACREERSY